MNMSKYVEIVRSRSNPPKAAVILLAFVFAFGQITIQRPKIQKFQVLHLSDMENLQYDAGRVIARVDTLNQMRLLPV